MEQREAQFYCPIASLETGRIHPASFQIGYGATGHLTQLKGNIYCITVGVHLAGFHNLEAAMNWIKRTNENDLPILVGMTRSTVPQVSRCIPFPEQVILDLITVADP